MKPEPKIPQVLVLEGRTVDLTNLVNEIHYLLSVPDVFAKKLSPGWKARFADMNRALALVQKELNVAYEKPEIIPMLLRCPVCHMRHIDEGELAIKPHKTHACQFCGEHFRVCNEYTAGVRFLPGAKNEGP